MPYNFEKKISKNDETKHKKTNFEKAILKYELTHVDRIVLAIIGVIGLAFFFKGLYILIDNIRLDPVVAMILGTILMFCSGYLIKGSKLWKMR
jgi:hypothetical protein